MTLSQQHASVKRIRRRPHDAPSHQAFERFMRELEAELDEVTQHLFEARRAFDGSRDFRKALKHADQAQQRLHRAIKRISGGKRQ